MSFDIQVPQWATVSEDQLVLSNVSDTEFRNTVLGSGIQGGQFTVSGNVLYLAAKTFNTNASTAVTSPQIIRDQTGDSYNVFLNVYPAPMAASPGTTNVLYQYRTVGLPITLQPQINASGYINTSSFPTTLSSTFTSNAYFSPILPPGLTSNLVGQVMTIAGTPTATRINPGIQTYYVKGSLGRLLSQAITLSVQNPQIQYTNVSGFSTVNNALLAAIDYGVSNEKQVLVDPTPLQFSVGTLPDGLALTLSGTNCLLLSGIPTTYPAGGVVTVPLRVVSSQTSNTTLTLSWNPTVTLNLPASYSQQSNVPFGFSVGATPQGGGTTVNWTLNPSAGLTISPTGLTATISGAIPANGSVGVKATISGTDISSSGTIPLFALADSVVFSNGNSDFSEIVYLEQPQDSSGEFLASSTSQQPIAQTVSDPLGLNNQQLTLSGGVITGQPFTAGQLSLSLFATTPQGVSNVRNLSYTFLPNVITFDPSQNFLVKPPLFIQGRPIEVDFTETERTYRATNSQGTLVLLQQTSDLNGTGLSIQGNLLTGTPVTSLSAVVSVTATRGTVSNTLSLGQIIQHDRLFLAQPTQSDFVVSTGDTLTQRLQAQTQSESSVSEQSLSGSVTGVSVSTDGVLTMTGVSAGGPTAFTINALTYAGITLSKNFTLTVNSGTFTSPTSTSALMPVGSSLAVATNPLTPLTLSSALTGFTFTDVANQQTFSNASGNVQPPELVVFESSSSLKWPLRVATDTLTLGCSIQSANWIQQVAIDPITLTGTSPNGDPVQFACPNPPAGLVWNPITHTLTGAPRQLTIQDTITFQATDGSTSGAITISYRVRVPQQLRGFSSPSGYTQQVRQRAIVNGAVHAVNRNAQLPDPLIATQGGSQPPDVAKPDQACIDGIVQQF